jgi:hypothetical protein
MVTGSRAVAQQGAKSVYFITADYAFGHDLEKQFADELVEQSSDSRASSSVASRPGRLRLGLAVASPNGCLHQALDDLGRAPIFPVYACNFSGFWPNMTTATAARRSLMRGRPGCPRCPSHRTPKSDTFDLDQAIDPSSLQRPIIADPSKGPSSSPAMMLRQTLARDRMLSMPHDHLYVTAH